MGGLRLRRLAAAANVSYLVDILRFLDQGSTEMRFFRISWNFLAACLVGGMFKGILKNFVGNGLDQDI
jgi:hypothetical protein